MEPFTKIISNLKRIHQSGNEFNLPSDFWNTIDQLPNDQLFYFVERMLKIKGLLLGNDFVRVSSINHQYRQYKNWTTKQKRSITMDLIRHWYYVELSLDMY